MDKPIIFYAVRPQVNRATGGTIYVPSIVEREEIVPLDEIVRRAIDRGLIVGIKDSAAKSIADAVARLPHDQREAVYLHYYEGYRISEIASLVGASEAAVTKRLSRARAALRHMLGDQS